MKPLLGLRNGCVAAILSLASAALLPTVTVIAAEPPTARLVNIATRAAVGGQAGTPIPGFVLAGTGTKPMLVRAVGPTLGNFGVSGVLADPRLSLLSGSTAVSTNDNWLAADAATMGAVGAFALAGGSKDAALVASLSPGAYTAPVAATDSGSGVVLLEVYDASSTTANMLVNASTRAYVGTGDSVLIPGFVIGGNGTLRLLIRAVGPTLGSFGVEGALADPTITLYRGNAALATNDNWSSAANAAEIASTATAVGAFALPAGSRDAAILTTLEPGAYSAIISGVGNTTGTVLMELYAVAGTTTTPPASTSVVAAGATLTRLASGLQFAEGPAADAAGNVFFTDIRGNTIHQWSVAGQPSVFRTNSGGANGLAFDRSGNLLACEGTNGRIVAISPQGNLYFTETAVLVYSSAGVRLEQIAVPERPTNVEFGGSDRQTLFLTTEAGSLYSIRMRVSP